MVGNMTTTDILIVEDDKNIANLLGEFLRDKGFVVTIANDGDKALALYKKYGARLLVLDIMLPGVDGFSILSKIREECNTPIIIVSENKALDNLTLL